MGNKFNSKMMEDSTVKKESFVPEESTVRNEFTLETEIDAQVEDDVNARQRDFSKQSTRLLCGGFMLFLCSVAYYYIGMC